MDREDITMELNQLPKVLVQTLDTLLGEHGLSSWQVRGGDIFTQVTLRFNMAERSTVDSVYRKVPDRRLTRDRDRAWQWRQHHEDKGYMAASIPNYGNGPSDLNSNTVPDSILESHIDTVETNNINHMSGSYSGAPHIEQQTSVEAAKHRDHDSATTEPKPPSGITDTTNNANITEVTFSGSGHDQQTGETAAQHSQDSAAYAEEPMPVYGNSSDGSILEAMQDVNNSKPVDVGQVAIKCNICHGECNRDGNVTWFRCTVCDDFDICKQCRKLHPRHNMWTHRFTYPVDCEHDGYCDSCGYVFTDMAMKVYQCTYCQDYVLCRQCMQHGMHGFHGKPKAMSLADYLEYEDSYD